MRKFTPTHTILREWHNKFNVLYFNNELKSPNFKLTNAKTFLGKWSGDKSLITISLHRDRTEREFQNTFIHEMIHQWQSETGKFRDSHKDKGHGYWFKLKAEEINRKGGWEIQRCSNTHGAKVADGMMKIRRKKVNYNQTYLFTWTTKGIKYFRHIRPTRIETMKNIVKCHPSYYTCAQLYLIEYTKELKAFYREAVSSLGGYHYYDSKEMVDKLIAEGKKLFL